MRNLDMTSLRSFVAVADHGGVTKAAGMLNFTQSAVSMQLKRLEEMLGITLLDRTSRRVALTAAYHRDERRGDDSADQQELRRGNRPRGAA